METMKMVLLFELEQLKKEIEQLKKEKNYLLDVVQNNAICTECKHYKFSARCARMYCEMEGDYSREYGACEGEDFEWKNNITINQNGGD